MLLDRRTVDGHWEGHVSSSALATATAVTALAVARRAGFGEPASEKLVDEGIRWLGATKNSDGGWGDTPASVSNISTTALVWAALSFGSGASVDEAVQGAAAWIEKSAGGPGPEQLAGALRARYGKDKTFSVPILTMCAIAGRLGPAERAWSLIPQLPFELALFPRRLFGALRLPVVSYALPALISMGLARHRRGPAPFLLGPLRTRAAARSLAVLDGLQPRNGGFLEAIPLTSFVAMSLVAGGEPQHPVVARGLGFLTRSVRPDGSWPIDTNLATWVTTLSVNALAGTGDLSMLHEDERKRIADWLLNQQWNIEHPYTGAAPGGWAWTDLPGGVPDADDTAGALVALAHLCRDDRGAREAAARGIKWLLDLQNRDGGIPTFCRGWGTLPFDRSATDLTAHAVRAWIAWRDVMDGALCARVDGAVRRAMKFLAKSQSGDGAFVPLWFGNQQERNEENPVVGTSRVLRGLQALPDAAGARSIHDRALRWLLAAQNSDGGWGAGPLVRSSIEETAVAVTAVAGSPRSSAAIESAASRGIEWIAHATDGFRHFSASPIGLYFARLWYSEDFYPLIFSADALATSGVSEDGAL